jgi:endonuclease-3
MAGRTTKKKAAERASETRTKPAASQRKDPVTIRITSVTTRVEDPKKRQDLARQVTEAMHKLYPEATCELRHGNALQLLVATILSAQCTDERVNRVTETLFQRYRAAQDYANANPAEFEQEIRPTGFFRNKTKSIIETGKKVAQDFGGKVPETMEELLTLPGVARKTANVVLGTAFGKPTGVVVDTHVSRLANRIGLSRQVAPEKIEEDLMAILPQGEWIFMGHALIWHGRRICHAKKPRCTECAVERICQKNGVETSA